MTKDILMAREAINLLNEFAQMGGRTQTKQNVKDISNLRNQRGIDYKANIFGFL